LKDLKGWARANLVDTVVEICGRIQKLENVPSGTCEEIGFG
jgi:hypothetical protein